jgi:hypothetical protein
MRFLFLFCFVAAGLLGGTGFGRAQTEAEVLLRKAIKCHGGAEALAKYKAMRLTLKVTLAGPDATPKEWKWSFAAPNQLKDVREGYYLGRRTASINVTNGKVAWTIREGRAVKLDAKLAEALKDQAHLMEVMRLTPLREKAYQLKSAGETKVDDRKALGLLVRTRGQKDLTLFFDAQSGLLVKVERKVISTSTLQMVKEERFFQAYPSRDVLPYARKVLVRHDGKMAQSYEVREVKFLEKADKDEFRRK